MKIPAVLRTLPLTSWAIVAVLAFLLVAVSWFAVTAPGRERARADKAVASANVKTQARDTAARETAADERLADHQSINAQEKDLTDAVASLPDARPSDRRRALACQRLRNDPRADQAAVSASCGSGG